jgi:ribosomal protein L22
MTDEERKDEETPVEETEEKPKRRRRSSRAKSGDGEKATQRDETAEGREGAKKPARSRTRAKKEEPAKAEAEADEEPKAEGEAEEEPKAAEPDEYPAEEEAEEKKPAPSRKREAPEAPLAPPVVRAQARYVRSPARKARLVCDHIRGKSVDEARAVLQFAPRAVARDWSKLLESAVANAEHNHELVGDDLRIKEAFADEGPTLKRYRPRAMGRATRIRKRTSHLTITLTPKENA